MATTGDDEGLITETAEWTDAGDLMQRIAGENNLAMALARVHTGAALWAAG